MTGLITKLWQSEELPAWNALYRSDGPARAAQIDEFAPGGLLLLEPFDVASRLQTEDPEWVTSVVVTREEEIPGRAGYLCCGETSYGSEGFFGRLDRDKKLIWAVLLDNANPFTDIVTDGVQATFTSTSGVSRTVDLRRPEFGQV
jgi:hypothetical protein